MIETDAPGQLIASLRAEGAEYCDRVRFHYLETLAKRRLQHRGAVRQILDGKLAEALAAYQERVEQSKIAATKVLAQTTQRASLAELTRYIEQHSPESIDPSLGGTIGSRGELKTIRNFRNTWSKLSVDKLVAKAIEKAPENAGPLNSHMLVVQSLALMRDIAPDYLNRFMSYVDTLLWLDQVDEKVSRGPKKTASGDSDKKAKGGRGRSR